MDACAHILIATGHEVLYFSYASRPPGQARVWTDRPRGYNDLTAFHLKMGHLILNLRKGYSYM